MKTAKATECSISFAIVKMQMIASYQRSLSFAAIVQFPVLLWAGAGEAEKRETVESPHDPIDHRSLNQSARWRPAALCLQLTLSLVS